MRIAVISDIHGNMDALESVLESIRKERCEKIFVLGDIAMAGPQPEDTIDWFMQNAEVYNITMIQGNTDAMIANYTEDLYKELAEKAPIMAEALKDDYANLGNQHKEFLQNLPSQKSIEIDGVKLLLVHGSPRRNNEDILPDTPMSEVRAMLHGVDEDVVLCGHTHIPCGFQTPEKKTVVNVGSVGRPFTEEPKACYLKLTITNGKCVFEHKFVEYNNERAALKLRKRVFIGVNKLANSLIDPQLRHF